MIQSVSFLGANLDLDDELLYYAPLDYWIRVDCDKDEVVFGLTPAAPLKEGGYRALEFTVGEKDQVEAGDTLAVAVTGKVRYLEVPVAGLVVKLNRTLEQDMAACLMQAGAGWLACIYTGGVLKTLSPWIDYSGYVEILHGYEGLCVPPGVKASGSPTCRSVYESIRKQKENW